MERPKAVLYMSKYSSSNNVMDTYGVQEKILTEYCKLKGYDILKVYKEEYVVNSLFDLANTSECQLKKLLEDYDNAVIDSDEYNVVILATDLTRFSEEQSVLYYFVSRLEEYADTEYVKIETVNDGMWFKDFDFNLKLETKLSQF